MEKALEEVRAAAVGQELDWELANRFPVSQQYVLEIPGEEKIRLHIYVPEQAKPGAAAIVNLHGGGFVKGYRGRDVIFSRSLAFQTGHLVADVDYQTAPEKKYPYAMMEGYRAACYLCQNYQKLGIDANQVILSGQSAGANMAVGISLLAKERKEFAVQQVILAYPPLDLVTDPMDKLFADTPEGQKAAETARLYNSWYVDQERAKEIYASPIYAKREQLEGLPPFLILTAELDSLREEGELFARHLVEAGVTVAVKRTLGAKHGFLVRRISGFEEAEQLMVRAICSRE